MIGVMSRTNLRIFTRKLFDIIIVMKILYLANIRLPTEKAHGIQIMKTCEAFADLGHKVELAVPWRTNGIKKDPFGYYGLKRNFEIKRLPSLDFVGKFGRIGFWIQSLTFAESACWYSLFKKTDIIYSRDELPLFNLSFFRKNIFWEAHTHRHNFIIKRLLKKCAGMVSITEGLKDFYAKKVADREKIFVAPDGVDLDKFGIGLNKKECRGKTGLPQNKKIIMYSGHLYDWKGATTLLEAARLFQSQNLQAENLFVFVGGTKKDVEIFKSKAGNMNLDNVLILGHKAHGDIPYYLKAADILVLPNRGDDEVSAKYTSPIKLFEYMAAGKPIVASDLPSIREILNQNNAILVEADNPQSLAKGVETVLRDLDLSDKIKDKALEDAKEYSWLKRGEKIISFLKAWNQK